jgi:hypothetical protein
VANFPHEWCPNCKSPEAGARRPRSISNLWTLVSNLKNVDFRKGMILKCFFYQDHSKFDLRSFKKDLTRSVIYIGVNNLHLLCFLGSRVGRPSDTSPVVRQFESRRLQIFDMYICYVYGNGRALTIYITVLVTRGRHFGARESV